MIKYNSTISNYDSESHTVGVVRVVFQQYGDLGQILIFLYFDIENVVAICGRHMVSVDFKLQ